MDSTVQIWEDIYKAGNFMEYPSEFFIRLLRRTESSLGIKGVTLDHGCGSGNNAECFYKAGYDIICSEVSRAALEITRDRLLKAGHSNPSCTLIDTTLPLSVQLPKYDNVICWLSLYYSEEKAMASSITQLISGMSSGGFFWLAMPTKKDLLFRLSKKRRGQTRVLGNNAGPQKGAVLTIFDEPSQIEKMFSGTRILDVGKYGMTFENCQHEYFVINARKI